VGRNFLDSRAKPFRAVLEEQVIFVARGPQFNARVPAGVVRDVVAANLFYAQEEEARKNMVKMEADDPCAQEEARKNMMKMEAEQGVPRERIRATDAAFNAVGLDGLLELARFTAEERGRKNPQEIYSACLLGHAKSREKLVVELRDDGLAAICLESECEKDISWRQP
jgi:hypothetical protein